jgi:hypothetical protein
MPDNLKNDDGKLAFKLKDGTIKMVLPEVNDLYIFPTTLEHAPMTNTDSTLDRIVLAGVWMELDTKIPLTKKDKTLL